MKPSNQRTQPKLQIETRSVLSSAIDNQAPSSTVFMVAQPVLTDSRFHQCVPLRTVISESSIGEVFFLPGFSYAFCRIFLWLNFYEETFPVFKAGSGQCIHTDTNAWLFWSLYLEFGIRIKQGFTDLYPDNSIFAAVQDS